MKLKEKTAIDENKKAYEAVKPLYDAKLAGAMKAAAPASEGATG